MHRIFPDSYQKTNDPDIFEYHISDNLSHHLKTVLKKSKDSTIEIAIDKIIYDCQIISINQNTLHAKRIAKKNINAVQTEIKLIQCLPKQDKMTEILKKCTELGVQHYLPIISERCDIKVTTQNKLKRWKTTIENASMQSKQICIPTLSPIQTMPKFLNSNSQSTHLKIVCFEEEKKQSLKQILTPLKAPQQIDLMIGPEGGLSQSEIDQLKRIGFQSVSLGATILRTENAGFAAISNILFHFSI